jgi:hypothetical protein
MYLNIQGGIIMDNGKQKENKEENKTNQEKTKSSTKVKNPNVTITTTVDSELYRKAKLNRISWKSALDIGICILLNEAKERDALIE